jgi:hypothetical protein
MKKTSIFFALFILVALTSCSRLREFPVSGRFDGIEMALDRQSTTSILVVHGMGGFSEGDPDTLVKTIEVQLDLQKCAPECVREIVDEETGKSYGFLRRQDYCGRCSTKNLRIYALEWTNTTWDEKARLRYFDGSCTAAKHRLPFVNEIKQENVNNSVADTVLYLSSYRHEIQYPFAQSIRWIQEDAKDDCRHENMVVGFSLGGMICIDALDAMQDSNIKQINDGSSGEIAKQFIHDTNAFFMLSNAYPLIELSDRHPFVAHQYDDSLHCDPTDPCEQSDPLIDYTCDQLEWDWESSTLGRFVKEKRTTDPCFQIVSINDPNDFISYNPMGYPVPSGNGCLNAFLNEDVRNATMSVFGFINPRDAHVGYGRNAKVLGMIIFGSEPCCNNRGR